MNTYAHFWGFFIASLVTGWRMNMQINFCLGYKK